MAPDPAEASSTAAPAPDDARPAVSGPELLARISALLANSTVDSSGADKLRNLLPTLRGAADAPAERWLTLGPAVHVGLLKGRPDAPPAKDHGVADGTGVGGCWLVVADRSPPLSLRACPVQG